MVSRGENCRTGDVILGFMFLMHGWGRRGKVIGKESLPTGVSDRKGARPSFSRSVDLLCAINS